MKRSKILTRLGHLSGKEAYWSFYLLSLLSIMAPIALMYIHLRGTPCIGETALNAFIVMLPYFFVGRRWRWTALLPVWAVALFFLSNLW